MEHLDDATAVRESIRRGEQVLGGWVSIGHPAVAEITAGADFDFVTIDVEHASMSIETVENLVRAVHTVPGETVPFVRPPSADPVAIKRVLDTGAGGLLVPRVDSAAEAKQVVEASTYPPDGIRGTGAGRAAAYGADLPAYLESADEALTRIVQIETEAAVDAAADIAAVDGIDALFVGPADLSAALDCHLDFSDSRFEEAVETVFEAGDAHDVPVGVFATEPQQVVDWIQSGYDFAIVGYDAKFLREGTAELVDAFEAGIYGFDEP
ncbi:HpcH/HpaI aldolase family protein [Haloarchaeobius amylolyticus]|uniref:HpcH/HpaI aldolase family protein n=1 Tax=Haloarchaeobius amylolyticus TaxID=1198296 RepID=UPI002271A687|nr:aldolase/citrate lyase family protein [Haloarchaeobius amylolyticus]